MKTKHFIIIFMAVLMPYLTMAQSFSKAFNKYGDKEGFDLVIVSGELLKMMINDSGKVNISGQDVDIKGIDLSAIKEIKVLNLNDDKDNFKQFEEFTKDIEAEIAAKSSYEELLKVNLSGEKVNVFALKEKQMIKEIAIYRRNTSEKQATLIYIQGPFKEEMINKIIQQATK